MPRRLTDEDIAIAVRLLDGWTGKLSWDRILRVLASELGGRLYTKPGLRKQVRILYAWQMAKQRLDESLQAADSPRHGDAAVVQLRQTIDRLRNENARLERENQDLLERFQRWSHNAAVDKGMTPAQLDREIV